MKKITVVSLASFAFLIVCSALAVLLRGSTLDALDSLFIGLAILVVSGIFAFVIRERKLVNILCFAANSVAMGFIIRAWHIVRGHKNSFAVMLVISFITVLYLWVFFALSKIPFIRKSPSSFVIFCIAYVILSIFAYICIVSTTETSYVSTLGYYMIIEFAFIFAMSLEVNDNSELIRNLALSTYSVFIVAIVVALFVAAALGGGDCDCDCAPDGCCDCGDLGSSGSNKKKNNIE